MVSLLRHATNEHAAPPERVVRSRRVRTLRQLVERSCVRGVPVLVGQLAQRLLDFPGDDGYGGMRRGHVGLWGAWVLVPFYA